MAEFKWVWGYLRKYRFIFLGALVMVVAVDLLNMINPYVQGIVVDRVFTNGHTEILITLVMIMIGSTLLKSILRYVYLNMFEYVSQSVIYTAREDIFRRVQELDFEFFDNTKTGDIMSRLTGDLEAVRNFTAATIYLLFLNAITFISVIIVLFTINALFTAILLCLTPITGYFTYKLAGTVRPAFWNIREQFSRLNSVVQESISGNRVIKAFAREDYEIYKFSRESAGFKDANLDASKIWEKYLPVLDSMAGALSVVIILVGGVLTINKTITLGQLVTFNSFIWALNDPMRMIGWLINDTQRFSACAEKIMIMMKREPKIRSEAADTQEEENPGKDAAVERTDRRGDEFAGKVEFRKVSFSYKDETVLRNVSFTAYPGQTVAVIGATGAGKSTLVGLISRFYDCTGGEILIDGKNIKEHDLKRLRANVGVAMQDIFLFSDTIEGNIAYGVPEIPVDRVEWAASLAGAEEFIRGFSEGYDTIIGERGVGLSGGQKQRIALARALVTDPKILILDDTTSSVDIETEHEIQKTLKNYYTDKTTFVIAHRISSVKNADLIMVLEDGVIIERGTHEELLRKKGYYYSVFQSQYGDFDRIAAGEAV